MEIREYAVMFEVESRHWWFQGTRSLVLELIAAHLPAETGASPPRIVDLGCGTGLTLTRLRERFGGEPVGLDIEPRALAFCRERGHERLFEGSLLATPFADESFDVVVALDVIEHLEDDLAAVREATRVLAPGGLLVLTVPACPWLWSEHDVALHHHRRYRARGLRALVREAGLEPLALGHLNGLLFAPAALVRLGRRVRSVWRREGEAPRSDVSLPPAPVNRALRSILELERYSLAHGGMPLGLSLYAVARKPGGRR